MADENSATVLQDGQLAVATVAQIGEIVSNPSEIDTTAVVQTESGKQLCVKTVSVGGGGGGGTAGANRDLSNLTNTGNALGAHLSFPSEETQSFTPTTGVLYTAPDDGYVFVGNTANGTPGSGTVRMTIMVCTSDSVDADHKTVILAIRDDGGTSTDSKQLYAPISKGQKFIVYSNVALEYITLVYANGLNIQASDISDTSGTADKDLSNLTATGNAFGAHLSFPSEDILNLEPTKDTLFTAPADGFVYAGNSTNGSGSNYYMALCVCSSDSSSVGSAEVLLAVRESGGTTGDAKHIYAPISKGQKFYVTANCSLTFLHFVYANGGSSNPGGGGSYILPPATASTLGGIKVGQNLTVESDGTLNAQAGGGGTVDQTYDSTSTNAQSGTAVAEAVAPALKNTATGTNALTILGTAASANYAVNIGVSTIVGINGSVTIGANASSGEAAVAIGGASAWNMAARASGGSSVAIGCNSEANKTNSIALGTRTAATANGAIQIGQKYGVYTVATNSTANSLQVYEYQLLDGTTGKIPTDRMAKIIELTTTSVQLASDNVYNGGELASVTLTLPATVPANFCCQVQFSSGATATTFSGTGIFFEGDECAGGIFTPSANHRYSIMIYNDGVNTIGFVYEK